MRGGQAPARGTGIVAGADPVVGEIGRAAGRRQGRDEVGPVGEDVGTVERGAGQPREGVTPEQARGAEGGRNDAGGPVVGAGNGDAQRRPREAGRIGRPRTIEGRPGGGGRRADAAVEHVVARIEAARSGHGDDLAGLGHVPRIQRRRGQAHPSILAHQPVSGDRRPVGGAEDGRTSVGAAHRHPEGCAGEGGDVGGRAAGVAHAIHAPVVGRVDLVVGKVRGAA